MKEIIPFPRSKFLKISCKKCKNEQIIFSKVSTVVKCLRCNEELAIPSGGEAYIKGKIVKALG